MIDLLNEKVVKNKTPFLGVCLGMHLLFENGAEGVLPGLGWIKGSVVKFDFSQIQDRKRLKIPHMGWNIVKPLNYDSLFNGLEAEARFYFVHSYHVICSNPREILATTTYGHEFTCAVRKDNIFGTQFHPEKSHRFGLNLFRNFLDYVSC